MTGRSVVVVGASNLDLISYVPRLPSPGETLHGSSFQMGCGGKGANQAVMAAKLGSPVVMVTKLGADVFGDGTLRNFQRHNIDTTHVHQTDAAFSGVAPIAVDPDGTNAIIIVTGANDHLTQYEIAQARPAIAAAAGSVASRSVTTKGTQTSFPDASELPADILRTDVLDARDETGFVLR